MRTAGVGQKDGDDEGADAGCRMLDAGCWILDTGCHVLVGNVGLQVSAARRLVLFHRLFMSNASIHMLLLILPANRIKQRAFANRQL